MKRILLLIVSISFFACGNAQQENQRTITKTVPAGDFNMLIDQRENEIVLDVRTPEEWSNGIIAGATKIDFYNDDFESKLKKLDANKPIMVYCAAGGRSAKAMKKLEELGFKEIYNLDGGMGAWEENKLPTTK